MKTKSMGRPTKYRPELAQELLDYTDSCEDVWIIKGEKRHLEVHLPTVTGFLLSANLLINRSTFYAWIKRHPAFFTAYQCLRNTQKAKLINRCLAGKYSWRIGRFMLVNNHNMRPRKQVKESLDLTPKLIVTTPETRALAVPGKNGSLSNLLPLRQRMN